MLRFTWQVQHVRLLGIQSLSFEPLLALTETQVLSTGPTLLGSEINSTAALCALHAVVMLHLHSHCVQVQQARLSEQF